MKTPFLRVASLAILAISAALPHAVAGFVNPCIIPTPEQQATFNPRICEIVQPNPPASYGLITLTNVPPGFAIQNGHYLGWCLDSAAPIDVEVPYKPVVYDSLDTVRLTAAGISTVNFDKLNYILNHKPAGATATDIQLAIWHFIGGGGIYETYLRDMPNLIIVPFPFVNAPIRDALINDAEANGTGFVPGPGDVKAIILDLPESLNPVPSPGSLEPGATAPFQRFCIEVTCPHGRFTTYTQGGWGAPPNGGNPGALLAANFASVYPAGVTIGTGFTLKFTSAKAIEVYLPQGGTPGRLTASAINPTTTKITAGVLAGQLLALRLSVDFSAAGVTPTGLGALKLRTGLFAGWTVLQILDLGNSAFGGAPLPPGVSYSGVNTALTTINENYDGGTVDNGYLIP